MLIRVGDNPEPIHLAVFLSDGKFTDDQSAAIENALRASEFYRGTGDGAQNLCPPLRVVASLPPVMRPPIPVDLSGYRARVAENWRRYGCEHLPVLNINAIDPEDPYGERLEGDRDDDERHL
jgi:hypothetical protein